MRHDLWRRCTVKRVDLKCRAVRPTKYHWVSVTTIDALDSCNVPQKIRVP